MDEAAPAAAAAATRKRSLLRRVPMSVIVTLVGIGLSAWILPAITRQWDDRQKAHELKTHVVEPMASATASALLGGDAIWSGRTVDRVKVADAWSLASLEIEARLRAYFGKEIVAAWQLYAWFVDRFDRGYRVQAEAGLLDARAQGFPLTDEAAWAAASIFRAGRSTRYGDGPSFQAHRLPEVSALAELAGRLTKELRGVPDLGSRPANIETGLFFFEQEIAREVLAAHPRGYSTTLSDFFNDLVP